MIMTGMFDGWKRSDPVDEDDWTSADEMYLKMDILL